MHLMSNTTNNNEGNMKVTSVGYCADMKMVKALEKKMVNVKVATAITEAISFLSKYSQSTVCIEDGSGFVVYTGKGKKIVSFG